MGLGQWKLWLHLWAVMVLLIGLYEDAVLDKLGIEPS